MGEKSFDIIANTFASLQAVLFNIQCYNFATYSTQGNDKKKLNNDAVIL